MVHRFLRHSRLRALAIAPTGVVLLLGLSWHSSTQAHSAARFSLGLPPLSSAQSCGSIPVPRITYLATLASGHTAGELHALGYITVPALVHSESGIVRSGDSTATATSGPIVVHAQSATRPVDVQAIGAAGVVTKIAPLLGRSENPAYRSCDYRFADSPGASQLLREAAPAMISSGLLTRTELDAPSSIYMVSDDPFKPGSEYVTVVMERPVPPATIQQPTPSAAQLLTAVTAEVDPSSGTVSNVGYANWYLGQ